MVPKTQVRVSLKSVKITYQNPKLGSEVMAYRFSKFHKNHVFSGKSFHRTSSEQATTLDFQRDTFLLFFTRHAKLFKGVSIGRIEIFPGAKLGLDVNWKLET